MTKEERIKLIEESKHHKVKIASTDIDGILRGKMILKEKFLEIALSDFGFCDVIFGWDANDRCYTNSDFTGWHTAYPDAKAQIDLSTYRTIPWNDELPFFLADFSNDNGEGLDICPRTLLKRIRLKATQMGIKPVFAQEFEWFNFLASSNDLNASGFNDLKPITSGMFGYSMLRPSQYQAYFNELFDFMKQFNVPLEGLHTETGPGVYEAAIRYDEVLAAADKAVLFKNGVKEIAYRHGIIASFMAKWNADLPGCSGHLHQSLWSLDGEKNLFFSEDKKERMSDVMESYLAGILFCMPYVMPMYAPTVNSYKRLRDGAWAPTTVSWGYENRTAAVRVIEGSEKAMRMELRIPGSDTNPYLAMAASLASGLYGIQNKLKLDKSASVGNAYAQIELEKLSNNLFDANHKMKNADIAKELFGEKFVHHFCQTREWEWMEYSKAVTNWELKRYFEII
ncbi:MAG: glutamine synthetase family protein [Prolixibacteraceae bacterium]